MAWPPKPCLRRRLLGGSLEPQDQRRHGRGGVLVRPGLPRYPIVARHRAGDAARAAGPGGGSARSARRTSAPAPRRPRARVPRADGPAARGAGGDRSHHAGMRRGVGDQPGLHATVAVATGEEELRVAPVEQLAAPVGVALRRGLVKTAARARRAWWARCDGIRWMGPYPTMARAWDALMRPDGTPAPDAGVWYGRQPT